MRQFQKRSKTLEIHRCDLKAERFLPVAYSAAGSNTGIDLINADFSISFRITFEITSICLIYTQTGAKSNFICAYGASAVVFVKNTHLVPSGIPDFGIIASGDMYLQNPRFAGGGIEFEHYTLPFIGCSHLR